MPDASPSFFLQKVTERTVSSPDRTPSETSVPPSALRVHSRPSRFNPSVRSGPVVPSSVVSSSVVRGPTPSLIAPSAAQRAPASVALPLRSRAAPAVRPSTPRGSVSTLNSAQRLSAPSAFQFSLRRGIFLNGHHCGIGYESQPAPFTRTPPGPLPSSAEHGGRLVLGLFGRLYGQRNATAAAAGPGLAGCPRCGRSPPRTPFRSRGRSRDNAGARSCAAQAVL